MSNLGNEP